MTDEWRHAAIAAGLDEFSALWEAHGEPLGDLNRARGGWSSAVRLSLPDSRVDGCVVKRQENFRARTLRHPISGVATLAREFFNLRRATRRGLPVTEPLYFARRRSGSTDQAILVLRGLTGHHGLNEWFGPLREENRGTTCVLLRQRMARAAGVLVRRCHDHGLLHNCLYPKHLMARAEGDSIVSLRLLDLEKARWPRVRSLAARRDLDSLLRRSRQFTNTERLRFWLAYRNEPRLTRASKRALKGMLRRARRNGKGLQWKPT